LEAIDRMYLNASVPSLKTGAGVVYFLKTRLGVRVPSTAMVAPMSERFVKAIEGFVAREGIDLPHPFTAAHRKAGCRYHLSILQAEFALTQSANVQRSRVPTSNVPMFP
jgi:hypothetical protein